MFSQAAHFQSGNRQDRIALKRGEAGPGEETSLEFGGAARPHLPDRLAKPWSAVSRDPRDPGQKAQEGKGRATVLTVDRGTLRRGEEESP